MSGSESLLGGGVSKPRCSWMQLAFLLFGIAAITSGIVAITMSIVASMKTSFSGNKENFQNAQSIADNINDRFRLGNQSKSIKTAGIVVRTFDHTVDDFDPTLYGFDSASLVNSRLPYIFQGNDRGDQWTSAGMVISPKAAEKCLMCAYPSDGHTQELPKCVDKNRTECVPGCYGAGLGQDQCDSHMTYQMYYTRSDSFLRTPVYHPGQIEIKKPTCAFPPERIDAMLREQSELVQGTKCAKACCTFPSCNYYNELVIDSACLSNSMPSAVEAFFFFDGGAATDKLSAEGIAIQRLINFKDHYNLGNIHAPVLRVSDLSQPSPFALHYF
mmetsp:Transcript_107264/g.185915  ORF Transcript_107264/g.185915 Transcript_107264/m.185915 type:complete len:329 (+) Transcript_107264:64-1050(+)